MDWLTTKAKTLFNNEADQVYTEWKSDNRVVNGLLHVNPYLLINIGGEMIYMIDSRLRKSGVSEQQKQKILQDKISLLFQDDLMSDIFVPQRMYPLLNIKGILIKIIMKSTFGPDQSDMGQFFSDVFINFKF